MKRARSAAFTPLQRSSTKPRRNSPKDMAVFADWFDKHLRGIKAKE